MNPEHENQRSGTAASGSAAKPGGGSRAAGQSSQGQTSGASGVGGETASRMAESAKQAGSRAKDAASSLGSRANEEAKRLADRQISMGAEIVGDVAEAVRAAAEKLEGNEPQLAHLAHGAAEMIEDFSDSIRDQSAEDLWHTSADFARRHPAVLFGATAGLGFLLFRLLKPGSSRSYGSGGMRQDYEWDEAEDARPGGVPGGRPAGATARPTPGGQTHGA